MDFDVVILGTGLSESITAAALSKAGYKVAHIDSNPYYGGDDASLTLDEIVTWAEEHADTRQSSSLTGQQNRRFSGVSYSGCLPSHSRQYAVSLQPTIIPSIGPLIDCLVASGVSRYGGFKLLERVAIHERPGVVKSVPGNKEDVFKNKQLSLLHKRRLMRFLMFAGGEFEGKTELEGYESTPFAAFLRDKFSLGEEAIQVLVYALAFCVSVADSTLPALHRIRRYLRSTGRYGPSSFLVGHYGGLGEISQGFCRTSAVGGTIYILGHKVLSIGPVAPPEAATRKYLVRLEDLEQELHCDVLVVSQHQASLVASLAECATSSESSGYALARGVVLVDRPVVFSTAESSTETTMSSDPTTTSVGLPDEESALEVDTAMLVFPPGSVAGGSTTTAVSVLITGEGSMAAPRGNWLLHFFMPIPQGHEQLRDAEALLRPYLDATLSLSPRVPGNDSRPLFSLFYTQHPGAQTSTDTHPSESIFISRPYSLFIPEVADSAATHGEAMFWSVTKALEAVGRYPQQCEEGGTEAADNVQRIPESFWAPLEYVEDVEDW